VSYDFPEYSALTVRALAEHATVLFASPADVPGGGPLPPGVHVVTVARARLRQPLRQLRGVLRIHRAIRRFRPDVVHLQHAHLWFGLSLRLLPRHVPLVVTVHDPIPHAGDHESRKTPPWVTRFGYRHATRLIAHGKFVADITSSTHGVERARITVVPHIALGDASRQPEITEVANTVLFFGRIWAYKGLDVLIAAQPRIAQAVPGARVVIAGRGEDMAHYRRLMRDPSAFEVRNEYIGDDEAARLFRQASVVVLPYVDASQSGVVALAATYGRPVVATRVGALPEAVEHEHNGLLVPPRDADALADAVVRVLCDDDLRAKMGARARELALTAWSPAAVAQQTLNVYREAMAASVVSPRRGGPSRR
jgi:glycosyltransferase involved in cell wall biosynthesis